MEISERLNLFEKLVFANLNTGHLIIEQGFSSMKNEKTFPTIKVWDQNLGKIGCSCENLNQKSEVLLATSTITHTSVITKSSDFLSIDANLEHIARFHNLSSVIGLGINGIHGKKVKYRKLSGAKREFLNFLKVNKVKIGCRGESTRNFLSSCGFDDKNLFVTGCPSLQLIEDVKTVIPNYFEKILISGSLINRLDLIKSMTSENTQILCVPQTLEDFSQITQISNHDKRIEVFTPTSSQDWLEKITCWGPQIALGTRFHGNVVSYAAGIPTVLMSGDIRTREMASNLALPFCNDIVEISEAVKEFTEFSSEIFYERKMLLKNQIRLCLSA